MKYNVICHHGILGQKWGIRRFQNRDGTLTSAGKQRKESERKGLTDKQKKILKGALITAGAAAVVGGGIYLAKTGKLDKLGIGAGSEFAESHKGDILGIGEPSHKQASSISEIKDAVTNINPSGSKTNCGSCSSSAIYNLSHVGEGKAIALSEVPEHMRRGQGYDPDKLIDCFENGKWEPISGMNRQEIHKKMEEKVLSFGEGAKGIFYTDGMRGNSPGHYFSWVVNDGKMTVVEGQPQSSKIEGIVWNSKEQLWDNVFSRFDPNANISVARLDTNGVVNIKKGREKDLFTIRK